MSERMTTRGSLARGQGKETFQGRVQEWIKKLSPVGGRQGSQRLTILKWVPTGAHSCSVAVSLLCMGQQLCKQGRLRAIAWLPGEKSQAHDGPRWPHLVPVCCALQACSRLDMS